MNQKKIGVLMLMMTLSGCVDFAVNDGRHKQGILTNATPGEVYTMRGGLGGVFSKGMNRLEDVLYTDYKIHASSTVWFKENSLSASIIKKYHAQKTHGPIILVGHSLGANDQIKVARALYQAEIPVALLMTIDAVSPMAVPPNVSHVVNIYKPSHLPLFRGLKVKVMDSKKTTLENINVNKIKDIHVNHFSIDSNSKVQAIMLAKILAELSTPKTRRNPREYSKYNG